MLQKRVLININKSYTFINIFQELFLHTESLLLVIFSLFKNYIMKVDSLLAACLKRSTHPGGTDQLSETPTYLYPWGILPPPLGWWISLVRHLPTSLPLGVTDQPSEIPTDPWGFFSPPPWVIEQRSKTPVCPHLWGEWTT